MDMKIDIKAYLNSKELTIYQVSKYSGEGTRPAQVIQQEANKCDISEFKRFGCFGTIAKQSDVASIERT